MLPGRVARVKVPKWREGLGAVARICKQILKCSPIQAGRPVLSRRRVVPCDEVGSRLGHELLEDGSICLESKSVTFEATTACHCVWLGRLGCSAEDPTVGLDDQSGGLMVCGAVRFSGLPFSGKARLWPRELLGSYPKQEAQRPSLPQALTSVLGTLLNYRQLRLLPPANRAHAASPALMAMLLSAPA